MESLKEDYLTSDGMSIDDDFISELIINKKANVHTNTDRTLQAFHVSTDRYGYNCLEGVNTPHRYISDGDYLVKQDSVSIKPISNQLFRTIYSERRI